MDFNFPYKPATGVGHLLRHASKSCVDLITKLCAYDPDERLAWDVDKKKIIFY